MTIKITSGKLILGGENRGLNLLVALAAMTICAAIIWFSGWVRWKCPVKQPGGTMRIDPYIGITGVTTREQAEALNSWAKAHPLPGGRVLMLGGLTSFKALQLGTASNPNRYLLPDQLQEVFLPGRQVCNLVHYNNSGASGLFHQVRDITTALTNCHGVQLNVPWPRKDQLELLFNSVYQHVVLQMGPQALEAVGRDASSLVERLRSLCLIGWDHGPIALVDRVLIDPSGGRGSGLDLDWISEVLGRLVESELPMSWGVAGGLGPDNLDQLDRLLEIYPGLSWDAETGLRDDDDQLCLDRCISYLEASIKLLRAE